MAKSGFVLGVRYWHGACWTNASKPFGVFAKKVEATAAAVEATMVVLRDRAVPERLAGFFAKCTATRYTQLERTVRLWARVYPHGERPSDVPELLRWEKPFPKSEEVRRAMALAIWRQLFVVNMVEMNGH